MERPSKRPRTGPASYDGDDDSVAEDELSMNPVQFDIEQDPLYELDRGRANAASRLKSRFESIFEKYERDFTGVGDEIDFHTGEVVIDNGHIEALLNEDTDVSESQSASEGVSDESETDGQWSTDRVISQNTPSEPAPESGEHKDRWTLPENLPDLDSLESLRLSSNGAVLSTTALGVQPMANLPAQRSYGGGITNAPLLNPALLQYDSFGQARMRRSLSDMLSRYNRSRLTNAGSFIQAQKSTSSTGAVQNGRPPGDSRFHRPEAYFGVSTGRDSWYSSQTYQSNGTPLHYTTKKVQELRKTHNIAKAKQGRAMGTRKLTRRPNNEVSQEAADEELSAVKPNRGRPRKIRDVEGGQDASSSTRGSEALSQAIISVPSQPKDRKQSAKRKDGGEAEPARAEMVATTDTAAERSLPGKRAYKRSLTSRRKKTTGPRRQLATKPGARRRKKGPISDHQRKSGRARKQTEFYGELISTLEIEQRLLESDDDSVAEHAANLTGLLQSPRSRNLGLRHELVSTTLSNPPSQRTIPDSQDPPSSIQTIRTAHQDARASLSPWRADRRIIRDSQDPSSSIPGPESVSPRKSMPLPVENFSRNEIDPAYGFSDDEEAGDVGIRKSPHHLQSANGDASSAARSARRAGSLPRSSAVLGSDSPEPSVAAEPTSFTLSALTPSMESARVGSNDTGNIQDGSPERETLPTQNRRHDPSASGVSSSQTSTAQRKSPSEASGSHTAEGSTQVIQQRALEIPQTETATRHIEVSDAIDSADVTEPPTEFHQSSSAARSSSLTVTGPEDEPVTPKIDRIKDIKVKTSSNSKRRVLALSNLVPDGYSRDGEEDELSTISPAKYGASPSLLSVLFQTGAMVKRRSSTSVIRSRTPDDRTREPSRRQSAHVRGVEMSEDSSSDVVDKSDQVRGGAEAQHSDVPVPPQRMRKIGFGFENARGAAPRTSTSPALSRAYPPTASSAGRRSVVVSRTKPSLEPSSPTKTSQISPLARRTLTSGTANAAATTPKNRKRKSRTSTRSAAGSHIDEDGVVVVVDDDDENGGNDTESSGEGELVQTPGGTLRRCGADGFTCDRDFCLVCCI